MVCPEAGESLSCKVPNFLTVVESGIMAGLLGRRKAGGRLCSVCYSCLVVRELIALDPQIC
jgi:hypothetical protein